VATSLRDNNKRLTAAVTATMPALLAEYGVGPVTAAILLTTWSHPGRFRNEAAYASLGGISPIPASSGRTTRHRLNRGGDRTLNSALHIIINTAGAMTPTPSPTSTAAAPTAKPTPKSAASSNATQHATSTESCRKTPQPLDKNTHRSGAILYAEIATKSLPILIERARWRLVASGP